MTALAKHYIKLASSVVIALAVLPLQGIVGLKSSADTLGCYNCTVGIISIPQHYIENILLFLIPPIGALAIYVLMRNRRSALILLGTFFTLDFFAYLMLWLLINVH